MRWITLIITVLSDLSKIPTILAFLATFGGGIFGLVKWHDHGIRKEAIVEFNEKQQQLLKEKEAIFKSQLEELQKRNDSLVLESLEKERKLQEAIANIQINIDSKDKNDIAPEYYKKLLKEMQKDFGGRK